MKRSARQHDSPHHDASDIGSGAAPATGTNMPVTDCCTAPWTSQRLITTSRGAACSGKAMTP